MTKQRAFVIAVGVIVVLTPPGHPLIARFVDRLRIDKPVPVTVGAGSAATSSRPLQDAIASMLTPTPTIALEEPDRALASASDAAAFAGFAPQLVRARHDSATLMGVGARTVQSAINRGTLRTILDESGRRNVPTPATLQGALFALQIPRAIRAQYGNCPLAAAPTIQGQLNGPPPPTADNGTCLALFESRPATANVPGDLPADQLATIAIELGGMSPNQAVAFHRVADWRAAIALSLPRGIRSYDTLVVHGAPAMLINTGGRRGPTYALVWQHDGRVFMLSGYGSAADAPALAESVR